jgi:UDP-N-acetylglucosamine acyltransferase
MSIHPTAIVSPRAKIDPSVDIGPYAIIEDDVTVGADCVIGPHVHLLGHTTIGRNCRLHTGVVIGDLPQDKSYKPCYSTVKIGDNNTFREYVTIHRGTMPDSSTTLGDNNYLMANAHVAHNVHIGNNVTLVNAVLLAGHAHVQDHATFGGMSGVHQFTRVGRLTMIGGQATLTMDLPPFMMAVERNTVANINVIGLRRAGYDAQAVRSVRRAYRVIYRSGKTLAGVIDELADDPSPLVQEIVAFMRAPSKRGIVGRHTGRLWQMRSLHTDDSR